MTTRSDTPGQLGRYYIIVRRHACRAPLRLYSTLCNVRTGPAIRITYISAHPSCNIHARDQVLPYASTNLSVHRGFLIHAHTLVLSSFLFAFCDTKFFHRPLRPSARSSVFTWLRTFCGVGSEGRFGFSTEEVHRYTSRLTIAGRDPIISEKRLVTARDEGTITGTRNCVIFAEGFL